MPTGRLGKVYVLDTSGASPVWVDMGTSREISVTAEPQTTDADAFGRQMALTHNVTLSVTLMQNDEATLKEILSDTNYHTVFVSNSPSAATPDPSTLAGGDGILLQNASVSVEATFNMGGEQSFVTLTISTRELSGNLFNLI